MRQRPIQASDWVYLLVSFVLSMWLVHAQTGELSFAEMRLLMFHRMSKGVRRVNIALMELELMLIHLCNRELERRNR